MRDTESEAIFGEAPKLRIAPSSQPVRVEGTREMLVKWETGDKLDARGAEPVTALTPRHCWVCLGRSWKLFSGSGIPRTHPSPLVYLSSCFEQ